jgi:hypothetical protein
VLMIALALSLLISSRVTYGPAQVSGFAATKFWNAPYVG